MHENLINLLIQRRKHVLPNLAQLPPFMHPFLEDVMHVVGNRQCGFRVVVGLVGYSVDDYQIIICLEQTIELNKHNI
jgi:hypothetical protein